MKSGFTLLELCVVLALLGLGLSLLVPRATRQLDRAAVLAAREATVAQIARARREARVSGGATLQLRRSGSRLWVESAVPIRDTLRLEARFGVRLVLSTESQSLPFDALGIGRLTSRTLSFSRGRERAALAVSAYGRVRRL
jgi:prepilin-type N-terminal cleavage/methylation domain-containing protein